MTDPAGSDRQQILQQCRAERCDLLRKWDQATESLISDYETETLATREELKRVTSMARRDLAKRSKPLDDEAEFRRLEILQAYDQEKDQPIRRRKTDEQAVGRAHATLQEHLGPLTDRVSRCGVASDTDGDDPQAPGRLGLRSPDSIRQSVEVLQQLAGRAADLNRRMRSGWLSTLVDHYLLPVFGSVGGVVLAAVAWFTPTEPSVGLAVGVSIAFIVAGILGHFVCQMPLRRSARGHAETVNDLHRAARHCVGKGMKISASVHRLEADDLVKRRDRQLAEIDGWLAAERNRLGDEQQTATRDTIVSFEKKLAALDQKFQAKIEASEASMRRAADDLAADINRRLEATR